MKSNKVFLLFTLISMLFANSVLAARMGGGRSYGMQRSISKSPSYKPAPRPTGQPAAAAGAQQRPGMGAGTAAVLGAAAGAAGGYMLGKSMSNNGTASGTAAAQPAEAASNIPWGVITILGILLVMGLMFFRKKANPGLSGNTNSMSSYNSQQTKFNIPNINKTNGAGSATPSTSKWSKFIPNAGAAAQPTTEQDKMPDGVEIMYFLRQVKGMFLHIQSMNNPDNAGEVEKYMTAELFTEMKANITSNAFIADFSNLDCQLLECTDKDGQLIASVKFFGMVSEEPEKPAIPFSEIWNFVKSAQTNNRWLVAGIQQETLNK